MLTLIMNDDGNFGSRLLNAQTGPDDAKCMPSASDASQWLQYWNDADTVIGNLRKVEHWLQRARQQSA